MRTQVLAVLDKQIRKCPEARRWCQPVGYGGGCFGTGEYWRRRCVGARGGLA